MPRVLIGKNETEIGAFQFADRKRPALCVQKGNKVVVYGYFKDQKTAEEFMHELAVAIGAKEE